MNVVSNLRTCTLHSLFQRDHHRTPREEEFVILYAVSCGAGKESQERTLNMALLVLLPVRIRVCTLKIPDLQVIQSQARNSSLLCQLYVTFTDGSWSFFNSAYYIELGLVASLKTHSCILKRMQPAPTPQHKKHQLMKVGTAISCSAPGTHVQFHGCKGS